MWLQSSPWSAIILIKWKVSFAVDGCRRSSFKDFDSQEAHWQVKLPIEQRIGLNGTLSLWTFGSSPCELSNLVNFWTLWTLRTFEPCELLNLVNLVNVWTFSLWTFLNFPFEHCPCELLSLWTFIFLTDDGLRIIRNVSKWKCIVFWRLFWCWWNYKIFSTKLYAHEMFGSREIRTIF